MDINENLNNIAGYSPSVDAIGQVRVVSANAPAEYGNVLGGDILYQTKSGTNQFHGSAFYFLGNYNLNANTWANKHTATITPKNSFTRNIFGGTIGGPILHDKLFFFGDYQGGRYHLGGPANATVLTVKERQGDFSELLNPSLMCLSTDSTAQCTGKLIQLYDATTPGFPAYPNNKIPIGANSAANYLLANPSLYPLPNQNPQAGSPATNNYRGAQKLRNYGDQFDIKGDWKATEKDNLSVRYTWGHFGTHHDQPAANQLRPRPYLPGMGSGDQCSPYLQRLDGERIPCRLHSHPDQWRGSSRSDRRLRTQRQQDPWHRLGRSRLSAAGVCRLLRARLRQFSQSSGI